MTVDRPQIRTISAESIVKTRPLTALLDCVRHYGLPTHETAPPKDDDTLPLQGTMAPFCLNRHNGHVNCLFLDWSVRKVGIKELWTLKWHENFNTTGPWTKAGGATTDKWPPWMRGFKDY